MNSREYITSLVIGCTLVLVILISVFFFYLPKRRWVKRVLFFPELNSENLSGEERYLPPGKFLEDNVKLLLEEVILGPADPAHERILPRSVDIESIMVRNGTLYLDLSREIIFSASEVNYSLDKMIGAVGSAVLFNFPQIDKLFLFINGQIPGERYAEGIHLNMKLLE